jgi:alpha-galactosidase
MPKIAFTGAGSSVFAKSVLGDCMLTESLRDAHIALYDIDPERLEDSHRMLEAVNRNVNEGRATFTTHCGPEQRPEALRGADYIVNAIQVGRYDPCTITDFEVPKKYGLRQTIADTLGIGGIFRALRTIPVLLDFARDIEAVCPDAWFLNYTNPIAMNMLGLLGGSGIRGVGLCHSVQGCARSLLKRLGMFDDVKKLQWKIAGINHQGWLLEVTDDGEDLYPEIKRRAFEMNDKARAGEADKHGDMVRFEIMRHFGYYVTESSEHLSEYLPWFIKRTHPELIDELNIPLDEYPRRCVHAIEKWAKQREELIEDPNIGHVKSHEYGSRIMNAVETDEPFVIGGNVPNTGLIPNLPAKAVVEVACLCDRNGVQGCYAGELPEQLAAINRTNVNVQLLTAEAALTGKRDKVYQAAMMDPHTASELTLDEIRALCDELIEAHGDWLPPLR